MRFFWIQWQTQISAKKKKKKKPALSLKTHLYGSRHTTFMSNSCTVKLEKKKTKKCQRFEPNWFIHILSVSFKSKAFLYIRHNPLIKDLDSFWRCTLSAPALLQTASFCTSFHPRLLGLLLFIENVSFHSLNFFFSFQSKWLIFNLSKPSLPLLSCYPSPPSQESLFEKNLSTSKGEIFRGCEL